MKIRKRTGPGGPPGLQNRSLPANAGRLGSTPRRFRQFQVGKIGEPVPDAADIWASSPRLGQHTDAVLTEVGFDPDSIARLRETATVG